MSDFNEPVSNLAVREEAHRLLELGYTPLPAVPEKKRPPFSWKRFQNTPPTHEELDQLFDKHPAATGLGIVTTGMVVLDFDSMSDGSPNPFPDDPEYMMALSVAPAVESPRGGLHLYFQAPTGLTIKNSASKIADRVDVRAAGGFLMVPPSVRGDRGYEWRGGEILNVGPDQLPELPQFITDLLVVSSTARKASPVPTEGLIFEKVRNHTLFRLASKWRGMGLGHDQILVLLRLENVNRCRPPLEDAELKCIAASASKFPPNEPDDQFVDHPDPGPIPDRLFEVPGFVSRVMDLMLSTAPRPNRALSFAGALMLLAHLAGRKVCTSTDLRTNIYIIALGSSGIGKDHQRKVIKIILFELGIGDTLIGSIASGQALEDEVRKNPSCLALTDEIDEVLMAIRQDKSGTRQNLPKVFMELFTSASAPYQTRVKVGHERSHVDQPNLCLFGTAIPERFFESLSARMMDDGFLARSIIVEGGQLGPRQQPGRIEIPEGILASARYWLEIESDASWDKDHPVPRVVAPNDEATGVLEQAADDFDEARRKAQADGDVSAVSIWARAWEHTSKFALLYAISESPETTYISREAALWAVEFVGHHTRRLIATIHGSIAENAFHALLIKARRKLAGAPNRTMPHSKFLKNMHVTTRDLDQIITVLEQSGEIQVTGRGVDQSATRGIFYRLVSE
jgi:hypothetical protein